MFKKNIILIIFIITLGSCSVPNWYKPHGYLTFRQMPKGGTPGFNLGWIHGCQSGMGSDFGMALGMTFYTWSKDPDIASSNPDIPKIKARYKKELKDINWNDEAEVKQNFSDYNTIFWSAVSFCKHSLLGSLQMSGVNPALPGDARYDPSSHSIGNVWKINGRGDTRIGSGDNSMW
jgi:hypothetical protein